MAISVNLEKHGLKKKGFLGFSWTSFFFNFMVPIFRTDFKGFIIFIAPLILLYVVVSLSDFISVNAQENILYPISLLIIIISRVILPFIYNSFYTKDLLKRGYLPPENDDYSNAILKGTRYLEYTNKDLLDKEKMERYKLIIEEYENERKKDMHSIVTIFVLLAFLIAFFVFF